MFGFVRNAADQIFPQLISVRGTTEKAWERKRPVWEGDRDRPPPKKRTRTKEGGESVEGNDDDV